MKKIPTIFDRNWDGDRKVIDKYVQDFDFSKAMATEKLDGTNVRVTVRKSRLVRLEKRRNPSKREKAEGITNPWYMDADENDPGDKYIWEAARNYTHYKNLQDGEYSAEALGPKIQGNLLNLDEHDICIFSVGFAPKFLDAPTTYNELKEWLPKQDSKFGTGKIEGIVWHWDDGSMAKIKTKDF